MGFVNQMVCVAVVAVAFAEPSAADIVDWAPPSPPAWSEDSWVRTEGGSLAMGYAAIIMVLVRMVARGREGPLSSALAWRAC